MQADDRQLHPPAHGAAVSPDVQHRDVESTTDEPESARVTPKVTPRQWGHLQILEKVGEGAFAEVYRARDPKLERDVALKLLRVRDNRGSDLDSSGIQEARLLARIRHQNVVTVYGVDRHEGRLGLWMEFIRGRTLQAIVRDHGPLGAREAALTGLDLGRAVAAVHALGLVHRDIKAQNVMREQGGRIVLMDFGVGQDSDGKGALEEEEGVCGTPRYMAPEILRGQKATVQSDLYSLGVLLYHLVTGAFPTEGRNVPELLRDHEQGRVKMLRDRRPDLPERFIQTVERAIAPEPAERFTTVGEMVRALNTSLEGEGLERTSEPVQLRLPSRRRTLLLAGVGVSLLFTASLWLLKPWVRPTTPVERQWALVADLENQSGDPSFDLTVRDLLAIALEQSRHFAVVPRSRVMETLELMRLPNTTRLDSGVAEQVCRREGISTLVTGRLASLGTGYEIVVRAADPYSGTVRALARESFQGKNELVGAVDRLTTQLRKALGEGGSLITRNSRPLERVTTPSFEALVRFSRALELHDQGKLEDALGWLQSAIEKDPEFAMAHRQLANYSYGLGKLDEALTSATRAYELRQRASERERHLIEAYYHMLRGDYMRAAESYRTVATLYPQDATAQYQLAQLYVWLGELNPAVEAMKRGVELSPNSVFHRGLLIVLLAEANREDEALQEVGAARAKGLLGHQLYWGEGLAYLGKGDLALARETFRKLAEGGRVYESWGRLYEAQSLILEGKLEEASRQLENDAWTHLKTENRDTYARASSWLARLYLMEGQPKRALAQLGSLGAQGASPSNLAALRTAAVLLAEMGEYAHAERIAGHLDDLAAQFPTMLCQGIAAHVRGELDRATGRWAAAERNLERARTLWGDVPTLWSAAQLRDGRGDCARALPLYQEILNRKGTVLRWEFSGILALSHLQAGRCQVKLGNPQQAAASYDRFLEHWGAGAGDLALVRAAKQERQALTVAR